MWFLVYTDFDMPKATVYVALDAGDEQAAIRMAKEAYAIKSQYRGADGLMYPRDPKVVYEVDLA